MSNPPFPPPAPAVGSGWAPDEAGEEYDTWGQDTMPTFFRSGGLTRISEAMTAEEAETRSTIGNTRRAAQSQAQSPLWQKLENLEQLRRAGIITETEYQERKSQLVDDLTGTCGSRRRRLPSSVASSVSRTLSRHNVAVPHPIPDFSTYRAERAVKHVLDFQRQQWTPVPIVVKIDPIPFARGALRLVHYMQILTEGADAAATVATATSAGPPVSAASTATDIAAATAAAAVRETAAPRRSRAAGEGVSRAPAGSSSSQHDLDPAAEHDAPLLPTAHAQSTAAAVPTEGSEERKEAAMEDAGAAGAGTAAAAGSAEGIFVAKFMENVNEPPESYFKDVEMQAWCAYLAELYNTHKPPRLVQFLDVWLVELVDRPGYMLCCVEPYITGKYHKHNNNNGFVNTEDMRNTPQAFSHFTFESTKCTMLVVDVQGVDDVYTDPQIHTLDGDGFGRGNLGRRGIERFLETHTCNAICRYLHLPPPNRNSLRVSEGTLPVEPYMAETRVQVVTVREKHFYTPYLRAYMQARSGQREDTPLLRRTLRQRYSGKATSRAATSAAHQLGRGGQEVRGAAPADNGPLDADEEDETARTTCFSCSLL